MVKAPILKLWLPYFVMAVGLTTLIYAAAQQDLRQGANDPQIQMAEDTAAALDSGATPQSLMAKTTVNMRTSLAPFLIVTDDNLNVLATSGTLDGHNMLPPAGVFAIAKNGSGKDSTIAHEDRITWQPAEGVRQAAVIVHHNGGYVVASRSLREVENREDHLTLMAVLTFAGILVAGLALLLIIR